MPSIAERKDCPKCGAKDSLDTRREFDPVDYVEGLCYECGYSYHTTEVQSTLAELNEERAKCGLCSVFRLRPRLSVQEDVTLKKIGICSKCGRLYTDLDDVSLIEKMVEAGYAPCPIIGCAGILHVRDEKPLGT